MKTTKDEQQSFKCDDGNNKQNRVIEHHIIHFPFLSFSNLHEKKNTTIRSSIHCIRGLNVRDGLKNNHREGNTTDGKDYNKEKYICTFNLKFSLCF